MDLCYFISGLTEKIKIRQERASFYSVVFVVVNASHSVSFLSKIILLHFWHNASFRKKTYKKLLLSLLNSPFRGHSLCTFSTLWRPLFWILSFISWLSENYSPFSLYVFKICVEDCLSKVFTALLLFRLGICTTKS